MGFFISENFKLTVESVVGEVEVKQEVKPIVEAVFGEISETIVESVFGEVPKVNVESVFGEISEIIVESVFGEIPKINVETVFGEVTNPKNYSNCDEGYRGNGWLEADYKIRVDGKQRSINCPEIGCTGPYYSYRWIEGKRQRAKYTPASKCPAVRKALAMRQPISEILKIISSQ
jgi:hypothetical protein